MYKVFSKLYDKFMEFSDYGAWEKQVEELIKEGQPNGKTLLDIGCGTGAVSYTHLTLPTKLEV